MTTPTLRNYTLFVRQTIGALAESGGELHRESFFQGPEMEMQHEASNRQLAPNGTTVCQGLPEQLDN